jgi:hypothetical protein
MDDGIVTILKIVAFIAGLILIISGFADLGIAITPENFLTHFLAILSGIGTGTLKITVGVVLVVAVIAPEALRVIFSR